MHFQVFIIFIESKLQSNNNVQRERFSSSEFRSQNSIEKAQEAMSDLSSSDSSQQQKLQELKNKMSIVGSMMHKHDKVIYKAFAVAIVDQEHIPLALNQISLNDEKFIQSKNVVMAFRINNPDEVIMDKSHKNQKPIVEGFDDGDLEGWGEKLLHLLQRVAVENILVIVAITYYGAIGKLGVQAYSNWVNITRELLTSLHDQALDYEDKSEAEGDEESEQNEVRNRVKLRESEQNSHKSQNIHNKSSSVSRTNAKDKRIMLNAGSLEKISASNPSVSENPESQISLRKSNFKNSMSPNFGKTRLFDNTQIMPRVFNFPEFNNQTKFQTNRRPNTYFSDLAEATSRFSTTKQKFASKFNEFRESFNFPQSSEKAFHDHLNSDLNLSFEQNKLKFSSMSMSPYTKQKLQEFTKITNEEFNYCVNYKQEIVKKIDRSHLLELR
jgi:hypothetical protein